MYIYYKSNLHKQRATLFFQSGQLDSAYHYQEIFHQSSLGKTNLETALPLDLIVVELLSNSLKHAFHHQSDGTIKISIDRNNELKKYPLRYSDNGSGFDFNPSSQNGLGLEIIKGLIDQLNGEYKISQGKGFDMTIYF